jgi:hypothetical protein
MHLTGIMFVLSRLSRYSRTASISCAVPIRRILNEQAFVMRLHFNERSITTSPLQNPVARHSILSFLSNCHFECQRVLHLGKYCWSSVNYHFMVSKIPPYCLHLSCSPDISYLLHMIHPFLGLLRLGQNTSLKWYSYFPLVSGRVISSCAF